ncbi:MAG: aminotransferase class I/II-fold pyridoxal phosphate-dependent enzyme [Verrucomicrobiota bacterium]|nr:aminotransferase class I/II-fold pyridoxal phosphate-dependent enzyme [Verrucomicrobiota bacterium]
MAAQVATALNSISHLRWDRPMTIRMSTISISRRRFAQLLGVGSAAALVRPNFSFAQGSPRVADPKATGIVRLSSKENPYGPSLNALQAMSDSFGISCRYPDKNSEALVEALAKLNGVPPEQILVGDGSGEILKLCADAFTGPLNNDIKESGRGKLIAADPTFESILAHARTAGAEVVKVPLTPTYSHDLAKMGAAAKQGLIYICNPNNPTASITPKKELADFIAKTPRETMILVDEAYFHYADSPDYESVIPMVKDHPNLLVARTFSKIYGMAGLRCGYCVAQKDAIARLRPHEQWDSVNCMALAAAVASLADANQVETGKHMNSEVKAFVSSELDSLGYKLVPSQANFIMFDLKRPVTPVIAALKQRDVQVGRLFPTMPNHMRLTIGRKSEMDTFLSAFREVMA